MLLSIDEGNPQPIYMQIVQQVKEQILSGQLRIGDELPSVRDLGDALDISLHTARNAYQVLSEGGLLRIRLGKKARVCREAFHVDVTSEVFAARVREVVVDGLLAGASTDELHRILEEQVQRFSARPGHQAHELEDES